MNKAGEKLVVTIEQIIEEIEHDLGAEPGLVKDGVEAHLQELLAEHITTLGEGYTLVRREYPDRLYQEIKRRDEMDENRSHSPLKPAADAVMLDTTGRTIDEVVVMILDLCRTKVGGGE